MAKINLNQEYRLKFTSDIKDLPCPWVLNTQSKLHPKFVKWGDLEGEIVIAKGMAQLLSNYAFVELVKGPKEEFTVPTKCLREITLKLPIVCTCESYMLARLGCKCGAFKREQRLKLPEAP